MNRHRLPPSELNGPRSMDYQLDQLELSLKRWEAVDFSGGNQVVAGNSWEQVTMGSHSW